MRWLIFLGLAAGLLSAGLYIYGNRDASEGFTLLTAKAERGSLISTVTSTGTVNAVVTVEVSSQISGQVAELFADFNDEVRENQPIARLDQRTFKAQVSGARAALEAAKAKLEVKRANVGRTRSTIERTVALKQVLTARVTQSREALEAATRELTRKRALRGRGVTAQTDLDLAETAQRTGTARLQEVEAQLLVHAQDVAIVQSELAQAEAELLDARANVQEKQAVLSAAEIDLERAIIRSPIDGVVIGRDVDRGQTVAASLEAPTLFTIAKDLREMEVHAKVDEADIGAVRAGQRAVFTVDAFSDRSFDATVVQIRKAPVVVENVVTYTVVLKTKNPRLLLLPGMTAVVRIVVAETEDVLTIPNGALRFTPPESLARRRTIPPMASEADNAAGDSREIWALDEDERPVALRITTGISGARMTEIVSGALKEGQQVVTGAVQEPARKGGSLGLRLGF